MPHFKSAGLCASFLGALFLSTFSSHLSTALGNTTDWVIAANNVFGPIIDRRAPGSAAVNGFTAPDSTGSTHPNANFSY